MTDAPETPAQESFGDALTRTTPPPRAVPPLIALNVAVFVALALAGAGVLSPQPAVNVRWGSNFGPLTADGEPALTLVIGLVDGINPCAMYVLVAMLGVLLHVRSRRLLLLFGGTLVLMSGVVYFLFMTAWLSIFTLTDLTRGVTWRDIEVVRGGGPPRLTFRGGAFRHFQRLGATSSLLTITHADTLALARWSFSRPTDNGNGLGTCVQRPCGAARTGFETARSTATGVGARRGACPDAPWARLRPAPELPSIV